MKALDTNVIVRLLVADDEAQAERAVQVLGRAESARQQLYVSTLVLLELVWVLDAAYGCSRAEILDALEQLTLLPVLKIERLDAVHRMIAESRRGNQDLADLLIGSCALDAGCDAVLTFDRTASKHGLFEPM